MTPQETGTTLRGRTTDAVRRVLATVMGRSRGKDAVPVPVAPFTYAPWNVLAAKVLFSHARNRQQLLGPPPTAFGQLDRRQAEILLGAAVSAAAAEGKPGDSAERRLRSALSAAGLLPEEPDVLASLLRQPPAAETLLRSVQDPHFASLFYAASLLGADRHAAAGQAWLHYLATRLHLPPAALERLHAQYGAA